MPSVQKIVRFSSRATPLILGAVEYLIIIERIYIYIYIYRRGAILIMSPGHRGYCPHLGDTLRLSEVIRGRGSFIAYSIRDEKFSRACTRIE